MVMCGALPVKMNDWSEEWDASNPEFHALFILEDGASVARIWGVKGQKFEGLPLEHDILSFIRDLGHSGDIIYLFDLNVNYLHQPWRAFATIINKCLSGKKTGMDKIRLSRA
ncbi:hypothetical protein Tco_1362651 [Tanacetum coccineum]